MKRIGLALVFVFPLSLLTATFALAADDAKVKAATNQVESGSSKVGEGFKETATGVGKTVSEGGKYSGDQLKGAGKAAGPPAKTAWGTVKSFFTDPFEGGNQDRRFQLDIDR